MLEGCRESFFSILLEQSPVFEDYLFSFDSSLIQKKAVLLNGKDGCYGHSNTRDGLTCLKFLQR
jgi:hypothetical protein